MTQSRANLVVEIKPEMNALPVLFNLGDLHSYMDSPEGPERLGYLAPGENRQKSVGIERIRCRGRYMFNTI